MTQLTFQKCQNKTWRLEYPIDGLVSILQLKLMRARSRIDVSKETGRLTEVGEIREKDATLRADIL